jgi:hypothetical protein
LSFVVICSEKLRVRSSELALAGEQALHQQPVSRIKNPVSTPGHLSLCTERSPKYNLQYCY